MSNKSKFIKRLSDSRKAVLQALWYFHLRGFVTQLPSGKIEISGSLEDDVDNGDLFLVVKDQLLRVEIKHRQEDFTGAHDFKYSDMIICSCESFDRADKTPWIYMHFNRLMTHFAVIKVSETFEHWTSRLVYDKHYDSHQDCYHCPLNFIEFWPLTGYKLEIK